MHRNLTGYRYVYVRPEKPYSALTKNVCLLISSLNSSASAVTLYPL